MDEKLPPSSTDAERSVLGSILLDWKILAKVERIVKIGDFYQEKHKHIYRAMLDLYKSMKPIDLLTLSDRLEDKQQLDAIGGYSELAGIMNSVPNALNAESYANIVAKKGRLRNIMEIGHYLSEHANQDIADPSKLIEEAGKSLMGVSDTSNDEQSTIGAVLDEYSLLQEQYSTAYKNGDRILGMSTGFPELDNMSDGIRGAHLWIIAGYSSVGKTYFSLNILRSLMQQRKRCVYYSLEMSPVDLISRLVSIIAGMAPQYILKGLVKKEEYPMVQNAKDFLANTDFAIHSTLHNLSAIKMSMMEEMMKKKVDCFFLDYVQLVQATGKEYDDMRLAATELQDLLKRLNVPMIMLSQISNEAAKKPDAMVMGFKGAGNLAHAADFGIEMFPGTKDMEMYKKNLADGVPVPVKFMIKKNRHGRTGNILMTFSSYIGQFQEVNERYEEKEDENDIDIRLPHAND